MKAMKHRQPSPRPGKPRPKQAKQKGVTLFELLLVLFVAAFIAVAVATIYNRVNTTNKENNLFNDVQQLAANIQSLYSGQGDYADLDDDIVMDAGIVPSNLRIGDNPAHQFDRNTGAAWTINVPGGSNPGEFEIEIDNLPNASVCTSIATKGLSVANQVKVGNSSPTTVSGVVSACSGNPSTVTLVFD